MKIFPNYHTHTEYCDGKGTPEDFVLEAIRLKMPALGFSGHAPVPFKSWWNMTESSFTTYLSETKKLKEKYECELKIYNGIEVDFIDGRVSANDFKSHNLDYIISSIHFLIPPKAKNPWDFIISSRTFTEGFSEYFDNEANKYLDFYFLQLNKMIERGGFNIIGHIDQCNKFNRKNAFFSEETPFYRNLIHETIEFVAQKDLIVEINTRGKLRNLSDVFYPSPKFLEICNEKGVKICLSADTHRTVELQSFLPEAAKYARQAGYKETFELCEKGWFPVPL